jgi:hypothetical protein
MERWPARQRTGVAVVAANVSQLDRLVAAAGRIEAHRAAVERGAPWPTGSQARGEGEEHWGPTEVLAHVAEMLPFWLGEMERVIDGGGTVDEPTPFGRTAADQVRTLTIARDATLPPRELFDRIEAGVERYRRRLPTLSAADVGRIGRHPTRGALAVPEMLERFVVSHLEEHAVQLAETLAEGVAE